MDLGIEGRVALITGSSQGIGRATAEAFAREGARVVVTYRHHADKAEAVVDAIRRRDGEAFAVFYDLGSRESIEAAVGAAVARFGGIDILVNNAAARGTPPAEPPLFEQIADADWRPLLRENVEGAFSTIQAALPAMRRGQWGRIVNVSSDIAAVGLPGAGWYAAAKSALHGVTRTLAKELAPAGVLVNVVMPGTTLTERFATLVAEAAARGEDTEPAAGRWLVPEEIARVIVFLCSAANTAITGEIVRVSG